MTSLSIKNLLQECALNERYFAGVGLRVTVKHPRAKQSDAGLEPRSGPDTGMCLTTAASRCAAVAVSLRRHAAERPIFARHSARQIAPSAAVRTLRTFAAGALSKEADRHQSGHGGHRFGQFVGNSLSRA